MIFAQRKKKKRKRRTDRKNFHKIIVEQNFAPVTQNRIASEGLAWRSEWADWVEGGTSIPDE
jgi:hypothetical protein